VTLISAIGRRGVPTIIPHPADAVVEELGGELAWSW